MLRITSPQNQRIKDTAHLREKSARRERGVFVVEGAREIDRALRSGFELEELFLAPDQFSTEAKELLKEHKLPDRNMVEVTEPVFAKLAMRENKDGLFAVFKSRVVGLKDLKPRQNMLLVVLETVEKPGNLGAVLRTADGAGVDAIIVLDPRCDIFNPNAIRASVGAIFSVPVVECSAQEFLEYCKKNKIKLVATTPHTETFHYTANLSQSVAILMGSEAFGLSPELMDQSDIKIKIPMRGIGDSLNLSVAAAIVVYEALRQRQGVHP